MENDFIEINGVKISFTSDVPKHIGMAGKSEMRTDKDGNLHEVNIGVEKSISQSLNAK
jgi:hypothetical protein